MVDVSICMPYWERMERLKVTLDSFIDCGYFDEGGIEVSICDDGSIDEPVPKEWLKREDIPFKICWMGKKDGWKNPCLPLNMAVRQTESPLILLQSPETYHPEPVLDKMAAEIKDVPDISLALVKSENHEKLPWYAHPEHRPVRYWFCQMMTREFYEAVGGMTEKYRDGASYDDNDFMSKLDLAGASWNWCQDCVVVHSKAPRRCGLPSIKTNRKIYFDECNRRLGK